MELLKQLKPQIIKDLEHPENIDINRLRSYLEILVELADKDFDFELDDEKENKELSDLYGERANLPKEKWVKAATTKEDIMTRILKK